MKSVLVLSFLLVNTISQIVPECKSPGILAAMKKNPAIKNHIIERHQGLSNARQIDFKKYNKYPVIENFLISLSNHPSVGPSGKGKIFAYREVIGKTAENREIHLIKIFQKKNGERGKRRRKMKPAILIDGGIHAREWISPAVVLYIINQLKNNPTKDPAIEKLVVMYDWYIIPVLNPDGYVYSYTTDPCWRKNRRQTSNDPKCFGVDLNRNFGFDNESWNPAVGGSRDPCDYQRFAGNGPFTEDESKALRRVMDRNKKKIVNFLAYWTFHNYLQIIAYPIGYDKLKELADKKDLQDAGNVAAAAIFKKHQKKYRVDQSSFIKEFGLIAGASDDYARGGANIKYSYTIELRDTGAKKFFLPATEIIPNGEEILEGVKAFANHIYKHRRKYYYYNKR
ncbi:carboxypeptidase B-like [Mytilus edulis]|uniref:carboxypeptidase B-like n=1 Tax=Mytilus edulis TaxID=6550 RepID=UPI0039F1345C